MKKELEQLIQSAWSDTDTYLQFSGVMQQAFELGKAQRAQAEPATRGWHTLKNVIQCLRETGQYWDEEGEETNALESLLNSVPQPATHKCAMCSHEGKPDPVIGCPRCRWDEMQPIAKIEQHPDDAAVDRFAIAMKAKLAKARDKGRGGWENRAFCSQEELSTKLAQHVAKGDPVDVANFCMMLHQRGEAILVPEPTEQELRDAFEEEAARRVRTMPALRSGQWHELAKSFFKAGWMASRGKGK